ncbi:hypothetical protein ACQP1W_29750 [Spirillospora sp. CA-255316]
MLIAPDVFIQRDEDGMVMLPAEYPASSGHRPGGAARHMVSVA